jgi:hypothetical protein
MSLDEKVIGFQKQFSELINGSLHDGCPLSPIIVTLDDAKFNLQMLLYRIREQQASKELTGKIIPANGAFKLPPPPGGCGRTVPDAP